MAEKISLKKLTNSDLTFFLSHYRRNPSIRQKAINLNADILVDIFYPGMSQAIRENEGRIPVNLHIYGPGAAGDLNLMRKIMKQESYKNYRLDGEYINNPLDQPERFDLLRPGDLAIVQFLGDLYPHSLNLFLISSSDPLDVDIYSSLSEFLGNQKMVVITSTQIIQLVENLSIPEDHPIYLLNLEFNLEDIALGGPPIVRHLGRHNRTYSITREMLNRAKESATRVGDLGEVFINLWLLQQLKNGLFLDLTGFLPRIQSLRTIFLLMSYLTIELLSM